jgi:hypothetical protein
MLESLKSFFAGQGLGADHAAISSWAKQRGHAFRRARDRDGFGVDGRHDGRTWRLEWGPSQRHYVEGHELRMRMELGLPHDLQLLLLSKPLLERLERETFEEFTKSNQTQMGDSTPEETRWLVMFPKIEMRALKALRAHFGGVSSLPADGPAWLDGPMAPALVRASRRLLLHAPPFVLMTLRGRLHLRLQLASPHVDDIAETLELFHIAAAAALHIAETRQEPRRDFAPSGTTAWQNLLPGRRSKRDG